MRPPGWGRQIWVEGTASAWWVQGAQCGGDAESTMGYAAGEGVEEWLVGRGLLDHCGAPWLLTLSLLGASGRTSAQK